MKKSVSLISLSFFPLIVLADAPTNLQGLIKIFTDIILGSIVPLLASLAFLVFLWGIAKFISNSGDAKTHADGKMMMVWGLVGLFIMMSYLAIIRAAHNDAGFNRPFGQPIIDIKE